ncbi:MAG: tyrosine-type recombinase/integrase [Actinobacteria bacterium]|nr:tyrosine-type recombinase/integrase [Actinomycetota bacterium]
MKMHYQWKSDMKELLQCYLSQKKMTGFKFEKQDRELQRFDDYYYRNGYTGVKFTKQMTEAFIYGTSYEKQSTHYKKEILLNSFSEYLIGQGYSVYVPPIKSAPAKRCSYVPYIFSKEQLRRFFKAIDGYPKSIQSNRNTVDPVLFRLLYGSGLRLSEALNLQLKDIDFKTGTLTILHAKNNRDRLVPIADSLTERFQKLFTQLHTFSGSSTYFFISPAGYRLDKSTVYCRFRDYLLVADISHTYNGPRIHDLRHSYCCHCLKKWVLSGKELTNLMPYLAAYMGHTDFRGTQYYLRLTADLYPDIIAKAEALYDYLIPEGVIYEEYK